MTGSVPGTYSWQVTLTKALKKKSACLRQVLMHDIKLFVLVAGLPIG
jgi:hypothetical protein